MGAAAAAAIALFCSVEFSGATAVGTAALSKATGAYTAPSRSRSRQRRKVYASIGN